MSPSASPAVTTSLAYLASTGDVRIAYVRTAGSGPGVVFLGGFMSDMTGTKATALEAWARDGNRAFVRFDYRGHGASEGVFEDGTIGTWLADALAVLDGATEGPQILVGSSMGGWIALLAARARPTRIAGLLGIAAAPDFTRRMWQDDFGESEREAIRRAGRVTVPSEYSEEGYVITRELLEEAEQHMLLDAPIPIRCPVRLLHGMRDEAVPWETSLRIAEQVETDDVEAILVGSGDHRLSEPADIERMLRTLKDLVEAASVQDG